jgi:hypothetical protein
MVRAYTKRAREPFLENGLWRVPLTDGKFAIVDKCDVDAVAVCKWYATRNGRDPHTYAKGRPISGVRYRMHRFIMEIAGHDLATLHVDHINGDTLDNRRSNLRVASNGLNNAARRKVTGSVPFKGVWDNGNGCFIASISKDKKLCRLGTFPTAIEAAKAYDTAATELFGDFAVTNQMLGLLA